MARRLREHAPNMRFAGLGGATETAVHATICEVDEPPSEWTAIPYGTPFSNNACRVVNSSGLDCPDWVSGELWVAGRGIARGYRGRPDLTADRFVEHAGRTWYRTGDLARYWPDGTLEFVGRADHRIKISGYRIELGDVEAALQRVAGVRAAVAAVVPVSGEHDILAAAVRIDQPELTEVQLRAAITEFVPPQMVPRLIVFVDHIPFTVGGKIDRRTVAARLADAVKPGESAARHRNPSTPVESALADIIAGLLGADRVGVDDDFFKLGADSVLATTIVARVRDWLDTPTVMVADVFATRTVAALAKRLRERETDPDRLEQVAECI
jgi:mycobactin phenyloxazoline synthetase